MSSRIIRAFALPAAAAVGLALAGAAAAPAATRPPRPPYGYVANSGSGSVTQFDTSLKTPGKSIGVTGSPGAMVFLPNGQFLYVASSAGVTPVSTYWNAAGELIAIKGGAAGMVITPNGETLYVTTSLTSTRVNTVIPISTATRKAGKPITFAPGAGQNPSPLVITPDGKTVYVASALGTVTPISTATGKAGKAIRFGFKDPAGTAHLAISPDGKTLYAFGSDPARTVTTVTAISTATNKAGAQVPVGQGPLTIAFSPDSKTAYVASSGEGPKRVVHAKLTPVSTATEKPARFLVLGPAADEIHLAVMPDGSRIYADAIWSGNKDNSTWAISTAPVAFIKHWFGPSYPRAMALTPDAKTLFVIDAARRGQGIVVNFTTADNRYHPGFWVGQVPTTIAIQP